MSRAARFDGCVCLVTGGGRGLGRSVALALGREGARVGVLSRTLEQCQAVAAEIGHEQALAIEADVADPGACERAVAELERRFGSLSILVSAAGISPVRQRAEVHDVDAFRQIVDVNLTGSYLMTRAAASRMLQNGRGSIVLIASVTGAHASPRLAAYGASKAAVMQLTRTLAREWADRGVRVNAVSPGYVETELTEEMLGIEHIRDEILRETPLGRLGTHEEIVGPILFLASEEASYVTGATLLVDGGMAA